MESLYLMLMFAASFVYPLIPKMITDAVNLKVLERRVSLVNIVDVLFEEYDKCLQNSKWLCVKEDSDSIWVKVW